MKARRLLVGLGIVCLTAAAWGQASPAASGGQRPSTATQPKPATSPASAGSAAPASASKAAQPKQVPAKQAQANSDQRKQVQTKPVIASPPVARSAPAAAALAVPPVAAVDGAQFLVRLRDLQARVDELKEQIRRSHARLSLLGDTILTGGVNAARAEIKFQNEMSAAFRVTRVLVVLDGAVQYNKADEGESLATQRQIPVFSGTIAPGDHTLQVSVKLRGHGYGVFSYLRGYTFDLKDELSFSVDEGKTIQIAAMAWEKGGTTTALEERPALRFISKLVTGIEQDAKKNEVSEGNKATASPAKPQVGPGAR